MKIIHFADLHLGVETYGHINPETGLPSRLEDFLGALDRLVDYAIEERVDLVLFCGDAYKSREPSQTQQREFAKRIKRLSAEGIPLFLLIGNHDLPNALGRATATEIFDTLSVSGVYLASRPGIYNVQTRSGTLQVAALPWVRRSALLSKEAGDRNLDFNQINEKLQQALTGIVMDMVSRLDPALPAVLAAHVWVMNARTGSEKSMSIGQEHMLLLSSVTNPAFDYVALGHIHKRQVLSESPPVVYSGSLERLDFGDEAVNPDDEKGFYLVNIEKGAADGLRKVSYDFHSIGARRFFSLAVTVEPDDPDPTAVVLRTVEASRDSIRNAIVRINVSLSRTSASKLRESEIRSAAGEAYYLNITRDVQRENRLRLTRGALEGITPEEALKAYLDSRYPADRAGELFEHGRRLIQEQGA
ncbi:MAG: exonuclease SbcCD subunit D [Dehalococcoidales bacterium]|nr:exonuclease SbcCD subunit D [Dehalococcoidales bacterium]